MILKNFLENKDYYRTFFEYGGNIYYFAEILYSLNDLDSFKTKFESIAENIRLKESDKKKFMEKLEKRDVCGLGTIEKNEKRNHPTYLILTLDKPRMLDTKTELTIGGVRSHEFHGTGQNPHSVIPLKDRTTFKRFENRATEKPTELLESEKEQEHIIPELENEDATIKVLQQTENHEVEKEQPKIEEIFKEEDDEAVFPEGKERFRLHMSKERNGELVKLAKRKHLQTDSKLSCQVCGFSFVEAYGELGEGFIEAHHLFPISQLTEETETKISDLALVCSNCHRMLHRQRPWLTLEALKYLTTK